MTEAAVRSKILSKMSISSPVALEKSDTTEGDTAGVGDQGSETL